MINQQGEYRNLTLEEIANAVTRFREATDVKQLTLAIEAGVDERTIQRIENGEKVNDDTLRKIAKAMRLHDNAFIGPRYVRKVEDVIVELEEQTKKLLADNLVVDAAEISTLKDCNEILSASVYCVDDSHVSDGIAEKVAALRDLLQDWGDIYLDLINAERLDGCKALMTSLREIQSAGYHIRFAAYTTEDRFRNACIVMLPKTDEQAARLKQMLVPRFVANRILGGTPL